MILSRRVSFHGFQLDEIDEYVVVKSLDPGTPQESVVTSEQMGGFGSRLVSSHYGMLEASVTFGINVYNTNQKRRRKIYDAVVGWAKQNNGAGWLKFNYMDTRRLYMDRTVIESTGDIREWTNDYTIKFQAYHVPFWENASGDTYINKNGDGSKVLPSRDPFSLAIEGTAPSVLNLEYRNDSGAVINDVIITLNSDQMTFTGIKLAANESLLIDHRRDGTIRARGVKWNARRTSITSARNVYGLMQGLDDLYVNPGFVDLDVKGYVNTFAKTGRLWVDSFARWL